MDTILWCISTISYPVNINGNSEEVFRLTRGIRQGDLISSFLFLCNERLSALMGLTLKYGLFAICG